MLNRYFKQPVIFACWLTLDDWQHNLWRTHASNHSAQNIHKLYSTVQIFLI